uniref:Leucine rich repeat protein n=1 Tax=Toxoplasma gondii COUG TaxID=1074873 RepID=A0A2G8XZW8_TOXGO|nr:leucine rich repeat protein [Toxoplasma gondii COUG]
MSANPCPLPAPSVLFGRHSRFSSALRFDRSSVNGASSLVADGSRSRGAGTQQHVSMHVSLQRKNLRDADIREFVQWLAASLQQQLRQFPPVGRSAPLLPGGVGAGAGPSVSASAPAVSGAKPASGAAKSEPAESEGEWPGAGEAPTGEALSPFLFTCCLDVSENLITAEGLSHLLGFFQAHPGSFRLAKLKLYKNRLGDAGARVLAAFIQPSLLPTTSSSSSLRRSGARAGKPSPSPPPALEELHLSHCDITAKGCLSLLDAVAAVVDDKGRYLYPRYDQVRRCLVPLWLRLEYNHINDPLGLLKQWSANLKDKRPLPSTGAGASASAGGAPLSFACFAEKLPLSSSGGRAASALGTSADGSAYFHCTPARCCRATSTFAPIFHVYMVTHQSSGVAPTPSSPSATASLGASGASGFSETPGTRRQGAGSTAPAALPALIGAHPSSAGLASRPGDAQTNSGRRRSFGAGGAPASNSANTGGSGGSQQTSRRGSSGGKKQSQSQTRGRARSSSGGTEPRPGVSGAGAGAKGPGDSGEVRAAGEGAARSQRPGAWGLKGGDDATRENAEVGGQEVRAPSSGGTKKEVDAERERRSGEKAGSRDRREPLGAAQTERNGGRVESGAVYGDKKVGAAPATGRLAPSSGVEIDKAEVGRCLPLYIFLDASAVLQMADRRENGLDSSSLFLSFQSLKTLCNEQLIVHRGRSVSSGSGQAARADACFAEAPESDLTLLLVVDAVQQELLGLSRGSFLGSSESLSLGQPGCGGRRGIDALEQLHTLATDFCLVEYVGCVQRPQPGPAAWARPKDPSRTVGGHGAEGGRGLDRGDKGRQASSRRGGSERESESVDFLLEEDDREEGNDFACLTPEEVAAGQRDANLSVHTLRTIDYALLWKAHLEEVSLHADPDRDTADLMFFITANPAVDTFIRQIAPPTVETRAQGGVGGASRAFLPCVLLQEFSLAVERHIETRNYSVKRPGHEDANWRPPPLTAADFRIAGASSLRRGQGRRIGYLPASGSSRVGPEAFFGSPAQGANDTFAGFPSLSDRARERRNSSVGRQGDLVSENAGLRVSPGGEERQAGSQTPRHGGFSSLDASAGLGLLHERDGEAYPTFLPPLIGTGFTNEAFLRESSGSRDQLVSDSVFGSPGSGPAYLPSDPLRPRGNSSLTNPPSLAALLCNSSGTRSGSVSGGALGEPGPADPEGPLGPGLGGPRHGLCNKGMTVAELEEMQLKMRRQQAEAEAASLERFVGPGPRGLGRVEDENGRTGRGADASERSPFLLASGSSDDNAGLFGVAPHTLGPHAGSSPEARRGPFDAGEAASSLAAMLPLLQRNSRLGDRPLGEDGDPAEEDFVLRCASSREKLQAHGAGSHSDIQARDAGRVSDDPGLSEVEIKCELIDAIAIVQELSSRVRLLCESSGNQGRSAHGGGPGSTPGDALMKEDLLRRAQDCVTRWRQLLLVANKRQELQEQSEQPQAHAGLGGAGAGPSAGRGERSVSDGSQQGLATEAGVSRPGGGPAVVLPPLQMQPHPRPRGAPPSLPPPRCWVTPGNGDPPSLTPPLHHPWRPQPDLSGPLFSQQSVHAWGSEGSDVRSGGAAGRGPPAGQEDPRGMLGLHPSLQPWRPADRDCGDNRGPDDDGQLPPGPASVPRALLPQRPVQSLQAILPPGVVVGAGPNTQAPTGCPQVQGGSRGL